MDHLDAGCHAISTIFISTETNLRRSIYLTTFSKYAKVWKNHCRLMETCNLKPADFLFDIKCMLQGNRLSPGTHIFAEMVSLRFPYFHETPGKFGMINLAMTRIFGLNKKKKMGKA